MIFRDPLIFLRLDIEHFGLGLEIELVHVFRNIIKNQFFSDITLESTDMTRGGQGSIFLQMFMFEHGAKHSLYAWCSWWTSGLILMIYELTF